MIMNKWALFALSFAVTMLGYLSTVDWTTLLPSKAGAIISAIGIAKMILDAIMPPTGQSTITSTGNSLFTHT